jgi:hypothetical protein
MDILGKVVTASIGALTVGVTAVPAYAGGASASIAVHGRFSGTATGHTLVVAAYAMPDAAALRSVGSGGHLVATGSLGSGGTWSRAAVRTNPMCPKGSW